MAVMALTGSFGTGKSTVLAMLAARGAHVVSADKLVHGYYVDRRHPVYIKVACAFPDVMRGGVISRQRLARHILSSAHARGVLERIVHPVVTSDLKHWVRQKKKTSRMCVAEVPLLFETGLQVLFDAVIVVTATREVCLKRIMRARGCLKSQALKRLRLGMPLKEKIKKADFIIDNSFSRHVLKKEVDSLWKRLKQNQKVKM